MFNPNAGNEWLKIAEWLENTKKAKLADPPDDGRPYREGARWQENEKDTKNVVGDHNVYDTSENDEMGRADDFGSGHGLIQVPAGKPVPDNKKIKIVHDANAKAAQVIQKAEEATIDEIFDAVDSLRNAFDTLVSSTNTKKASQKTEVKSSNRSNQNYGYSNSAFDLSNLTKTANEKIVKDYINFGNINADIYYHYISGFSNELNNLTKAASSGEIYRYLAADPYTKDRDAVTLLFMDTLNKRAEDMAPLLDQANSKGLAPPPPPGTMGSSTEKTDNSNDFFPSGGEGGDETDEAYKGDESAARPSLSTESSSEKGESEEKKITLDDFVAAAYELGYTKEEIEELLNVLKSELGIDLEKEDIDQEMIDSRIAASEKTNEGKETTEDKDKMMKTKSSSVKIKSQKKKAAERIYKEAESILRPVIEYMESGEFRFKPAADGTPERRRREIAKKYLMELCNIIS